MLNFCILIDAFKNQLETKKRERSRSPSRRHKRDRERDRSDRGEKKKDRRESIDKIKRRRSRSREPTRERSGVVFRDYGHGRGRNDRPDRSERERTDRGDRSESKREQNGDRRKEKKKVEVKEESIWGEGELPISGFFGRNVGNFSANFCQN